MEKRIESASDFLNNPEVSIRRMREERKHRRAKLLAEAERRVDEIMAMDPEPEIPKAIKDLVIFETSPSVFVSLSGLSHNDAVLEAYQRGQRSNIGRR